MKKILAIATVLLLSACASDMELQQEGSGSDEMKPSPCACDPIPYQFKGITWKNKDLV